MDDQTFWDVAFAQIVGIQYHPANPPETRMTLEELADVATEMLLVRNRRCQ